MEFATSKSYVSKKTTDNYKRKREAKESKKDAKNDEKKNLEVAVAGRPSEEEEEKKEPAKREESAQILDSAMLNMLPQIAEDEEDRSRSYSDCYSGDLKGGLDVSDMEEDEPSGEDAPVKQIQEE